jgi:hypothetical protein
MLVKSTHRTEINLLKTHSFEFLSSFLFSLFCFFYARNFTYKRCVELLNWVGVFFMSVELSCRFQTEVQTFVIVL